MTQQIVWTRLQQTEALKAVSLIKANRSSTDPQQNVRATQAELLRLVGSESDREFAAKGPLLLAALVNVAALITDHYSDSTDVPVEQLLATLTEELQNMPVTEG
ncbi:hypothetical protein [Mycolicibacterium neoaurum]|uniref:hypothetical protein n=1 Tax=Mycolicibacterium neoaurum TaxID=1795 RepID=UPI001F4D1406|nr:hypothetical protein [Mycolicibacterium neoaurum]